MTDSAHQLEHVFWLGGPPCAGKSSVSEILAGRFGLDVYHLDEAFAAHARRLDPARHPTLTRLCGAAWNETLARPVESIVQDAVACCREHFALVLEDLLAKPPLKPLLVEGAALPPREVAAVLRRQERAAWLVPAPDFQSRHCSKREWVGGIVGQCDDPEAALRAWLARDAALAAWLTAEAGALGLRLVRVDGGRTPEETAAEVAAHFRLDATRNRGMDFVIRKATLEDRAAITELIAASARGLSRADYSERQIEAALSTVFGVDTSLILDGTYFVAESEGALVGCGGWSKRRTLFGGDQYAERDASELDPRTEPARIRAFFVHPEHARRGVGRAVLAACESAARACGFSSLELMATLPGVRLYRACGYEGDARVAFEIGGGVSIEFVPMRKELR